jgi:hypothetical protein
MEIVEYLHTKEHFTRLKLKIISIAELLLEDEQYTTDVILEDVMDLLSELEECEHIYLDKDSKLIAPLE